MSNTRYTTLFVYFKHAWLENRKLHTFGPSVPCLFILMELANGGNLEEYIQLQEPSEDSKVESQFTDGSARNRMRAKSLINVEYIDGPKLVDDECLRNGGIGMGLKGKKVKFLQLKEILSLFLDVCRGITHLHDHSIIHRDLKPPNLLLHFDDIGNKNEM